MSVSLTTALIELERYVAGAGWDQAPRLFALVETADLLRREAVRSGPDLVPGPAQALARTLADLTRWT